MPSACLDSKKEIQSKSLKLSNKSQNTAETMIYIS